MPARLLLPVRLHNWHKQSASGEPEVRDCDNCSLDLGTIAIAALVLMPRLREERIVFDVAPDRPVPFGYKMAWLALRTRDTQRVVEADRSGRAAALQLAVGHRHGL